MLEDKIKGRIKDLKVFADELVENKVAGIDAYKIVLDGATKLSSCRDINEVESIYYTYIAELGAIKTNKRKSDLKSKLQEHAQNLIEAGGVLEESVLEELSRAQREIELCEVEIELNKIYFSSISSMDSLKLDKHMNSYILRIEKMLYDANLDDVMFAEIMESSYELLSKCVSVEEMEAIYLNAEQRVKYINMPIDELKIFTKERLLEQAKQYINLENYEVILVMIKETFAQIENCNDRYKIELLEQEVLMMIGEYSIRTPNIKR